MKKLLIIPILAAVAIAGCKKKNDISSKVVTVSYPTITFTGSQYVSIPVGGSVPTISATAYDSTLKEVDKVTDTGAVDVNTPGLYVQTAYTQNSNGYVTTAAVYIAVTNISSGIDLSGLYLRGANPANVTKLANGLYMTDNVGGDDPVTQADAIVPAVFAQLDDTTLSLTSQPTITGTLYATNASVSMSPGDTTFQYIVINPTFGASVRTFVKQ